MPIHTYLYICMSHIYMCIYIGCGGRIGRAQASRMGDQEFGSQSSQTVESN